MRDEYVVVGGRVIFIYTFFRKLKTSSKIKGNERNDVVVGRGQIKQNPRNLYILLENQRVVC